MITHHCINGNINSESKTKFNIILLHSAKNKCKRSNSLLSQHSVIEEGAELGISILFHAKISIDIRPHLPVMAHTKGDLVMMRPYHFLLHIYIFTGLTAFPFTTAGSELHDMSMNERLIKLAWASYNKRDYKSAIVYAQQCIDEFQADADRDQAMLTRNNVPMPKKGKVSKIEREKILERGLLNDVATAFFIVGRSAEYLSQSSSAHRALKRCASYTYARTWDPKGWFWMPAQACADRLKNLD